RASSGWGAWCSGLVLDGPAATDGGAERGGADGAGAAGLEVGEVEADGHVLVDALADALAGDLDVWHLETALVLTDQHVASLAGLHDHVPAVGDQVGVQAGGDQVVAPVDDQAFGAQGEVDLPRYRSGAVLDVQQLGDAGVGIEA